MSLYGADGRLMELCTTHFRGHETDFHRLLAEFMDQPLKNPS